MVPSRVLVVEDHATLADRISQGLRQAGMAVDAVYDGATALDAAACGWYPSGCPGPSRRSSALSATGMGERTVAEDTLDRLVPLAAARPVAAPDGSCPAVHGGDSAGLGRANEAIPGSLAKGGDEAVAVAGPGGDHDVAGFDAVEGDGGEVGSEARSGTGRDDGDAAARGDELQLVLDGVDDRLLGQVRALGPASEVLRRAPWGMAQAGDGLAFEVLEGDRLLACQAVVQVDEHHLGLVVEDGRLLFFFDGTVAPW